MVVVPSVVIIVIVIGIIVAVIAIDRQKKKHTENLRNIEEQHSVNRRKVIKEARNDVLGILKILPEIKDNQEIMDLLIRDLEDMKCGIMEEGAIVSDEGEGISVAEANCCHGCCFH